MLFLFLFLKKGIILTKIMFVFIPIFLTFCSNCLQVYASIGFNNTEKQATQTNNIENKENPSSLSTPIPLSFFFDKKKRFCSKTHKTQKEKQKHPKKSNNPFYSHSQHFLHSHSFPSKKFIII